ncbi:MAG: acetylglutamate kinase [Anaerolineae bacterium]|nr:acetylglutamate kinase [Anaerolineae bacterium]MCB9461597.1 acetylglutamate kinase [Anaerolineaceae bacterium]
MTETWVIKISGHQLDDEAFLSEFISTVANLPHHIVLVHGGGKEISQLQQRLGIEPHFADGIRVTDAESLALVEMVLCGLVNKRLVRMLVARNVAAIGISGVDMGLIEAEKLANPNIDMMFTGEIKSLNIEPLKKLLDSGLTPVIAPISYSKDHNYNVNADHVTGALSSALSADRTFFISNVPGVMADGQVIGQLTPQQAEQLIHEEVIVGGMIPKVRTALDVLDAGVRRVIITDLDGLQNQTGTTFLEGE